LEFNLTHPLGRTVCPKYRNTEYLKFIENIETPLCEARSTAAPAAPAVVPPHVVPPPPNPAGLGDIGLGLIAIRKVLNNLLPKGFNAKHKME